MTLAPSRIRRRSSLQRNWRLPMSTDQRTGARVNIGGNAGRFEPLVYSEKWQDEGWFTLAYPELRSAAKPLFGGGLAEYTTSDRKHSWYLTEAGDLEYELILGSLPLSNVFDFEIDFPQGMVFEYQAPLNQEIDGRVAFATETEAWAAGGRLIKRRPENIVGSYALYWPKSNNQYETGKVGHIHRPQFIDAKGRKTWGTMELDADRKRLRITCPAKWLAKAAYPVILDPTIGYTSLGASTDATGKYSLMTDITAASSGDANPGTAFSGGNKATGGATHNITVCVYTGGGANPVGKSLIAESSAISQSSTTKQWFSAAITWTGITNGTHYWLGMWSNHVDTEIAYDSGSATGNYHGQTATANAPATFPSLADQGAFNNRVSNYVDFTAAGGGATLRRYTLTTLGVG